MLQPKFLATKEMNRVCCPPFLCLIKTQCPQMNQLLYMRSLYPKNSTWKPKLKEPAVDDAGSKVCFNNPMRSENFFFYYFLLARSKLISENSFSANELLVRTLLSYSSVHGSQGGGLASVRMELILLLQELQQDRRLNPGTIHSRN